MTDPSSLQELVRQVRRGKYRAVCPDVIARIGARELAHRNDLRQAIKATRNKLHQIGGAYLPPRSPYARWLAELAQAAAQGDPQALRQASRAILQEHASTRERLPILETFFHTVFEGLAPVVSILDVACGLTPLAIPWMPLAPLATYYAYDMYADLMAFLSAALGHLGVRGEAEERDVLGAAPFPQAQVGLLLKAIPCLEQVERTAGERLLSALPVQRLVVSFPVRSLGGRDKGMVAHYEAHLESLVRDKPWTVTRHLFETELAFVIDKGPAAK